MAVGGRRPGQTLRSSHASSAATASTPATPAAAYHGRSPDDNSNAPLQGAVVAVDISKAYSVICPATCLRGHMSAGFRSASAASPVANLKAHYATHGRPGGRNRYVATLDRTSSAYDPCFRGRLTSDGWPVREGNAGSSNM
ncbi:Regulatory protein brlA [Penicillium subrubescens]|uniref:Regulatory protein brlA n=1 Tax=Penicillium subrubescens TaxID=1316194 RepID=A0A1Q5UR72_9EURO|nr:Regulatory protein brlA [Penicillium subrubescens]